MISSRIKIIILFLLIPSVLLAHGDLLIRIKQKTEEISKNPKNAFLYLERGYLYQQHEEYHKAITDYLKSERLGNKTKLLYYRKAKTYYYNANYKKALRAVQKCQKFDEIDVKTHKLKAQTLVKLTQYKRALKAYDYVIKNTIDIRPEDIIEYSEIVLKLHPSNYSKAIFAIDKGLEKLGKNTLTLQLKKMEYLKANNQPEKVLAIYNDLIIANRRKEFLYYRKAAYLFELDRIQEAIIAIEQAKLAIEQLSVKFQNTQAVRELMKDINDLKKQIKDD